MGIRGLSTFFNDQFTSISDRINLSNKLLVVDGYAFLYYFSGKSNDYDEYLSKINEWLDTMINKSKTKMVFIFDSPVKRNSLKFNTKIERMKMTTQNVNNNSENTEGILPLLAERIALSTLCDRKNVQILRCTGDEESDKEIFIYAFKNKAVGILSNDSDFCAYVIPNITSLSTPRLIPIWTLAFCPEKGTAFAHAISQKKLAGALSLNNVSELSILAALVGNDYTDDELTKVISQRLLQQCGQRKDFKIGTKALKKRFNNSQKNILIASKVIAYTRGISLFETFDTNTDFEEHVQSILKWIYGPQAGNNNNNNNNKSRERDVLYAKTMKQIKTCMEHYTCNSSNVDDSQLDQHMLYIGQFGKDLVCSNKNTKQDKPKMQEEVMYFAPVQLNCLHNSLQPRYSKIRYRCLSLIARLHSNTYNFVHARVTNNGNLIENRIRPCETVFEGNHSRRFLKYLCWVLDMKPTQDLDGGITWSYCGRPGSDIAACLRSNEVAFNDWDGLIGMYSCTFVLNSIIPYELESGECISGNTGCYHNEIRKVVWAVLLHLIHRSDTVDKDGRQTHSVTQATIALYHVTMAIDAVNYFLQGLSPNHEHFDFFDHSKHWKDFALNLKEIKNRASSENNCLTRIFF